MRRNVDLTIVLFNNKIYGLTKGQYSPTSEIGKRTKSSPYGSIDYPLNPLSVALGAEGTFVARSIDIDQQHLMSTLERGARHKGAAFIEVYQNCNVFNDGAHMEFADKAVRPDRTLVLEHGKPMVFGKDRDKGIRMNGIRPEIVQLGNGVTEADLAVHDEATEDPTMHEILARMHWPEFPEIMGVIRAVERPTYDTLMTEQVAEVTQRMGPGDLAALLAEGDTWEVK
jgi:2-oxoglutarate ferredoxin oxidoreductase subunit beta